MIQALSSQAHHCSRLCWPTVNRNKHRSTQPKEKCRPHFIYWEQSGTFFIFIRKTWMTQLYSFTVSIWWDWGRVWNETKGCLLAVLGSFQKWGAGGMPVKLSISVQIPNWNTVWRLSPNQNILSTSVFWENDTGEQKTIMWNSFSVFIYPSLCQPGRRWWW